MQVLYSCFLLSCTLEGFFLQFDWHFRARAGIIYVAVASAWLAVLLLLRLAVQQYKQRRQFRRVAPLLITATSH